jgi:NTE family protein
LDKSEKVFCVFEGGGAKGVAHLGVLGAIESVKEFDVQGFAGTSAGAIMAALAAVGYSSDELLTFKRDVPIRSPALEAINRGGVKSLAELIGPDWRKLS